MWKRFQMMSMELEMRTRQTFGPVALFAWAGRRRHAELRRRLDGETAASSATGLRSAHAREAGPHTPGKNTPV
jgi:hypothetical protein